MDITHFMWKHGGIPGELGWKNIVLIPKGNTDIRGIGILKFLWRVVEALVETRLRASACLHDILHEFRTGKVMGTDIL